MTNQYRLSALLIAAWCIIGVQAAYASPPQMLHIHDDPVSFNFSEDADSCTPESGICTKSRTIWIPTSISTQFNKALVMIKSVAFNIGNQADVAGLGVQLGSPQYNASTGKVTYTLTTNTYGAGHAYSVDMTTEIVLLTTSGAVPHWTVKNATIDAEDYYPHQHVTHVGSAIPDALGTIDINGIFSFQMYTGFGVTKLQVWNPEGIPLPNLAQVGVKVSATVDHGAGTVTPSIDCALVTSAQTGISCEASIVTLASNDLTGAVSHNGISGVSLTGWSVPPDSDFGIYVNGFFTTLDGFRFDNPMGTRDPGAPTFLAAACEDYLPEDYVRGTDMTGWYGGVATTVSSSGTSETHNILQYCTTHFSR